ncbi:MAG: hypothetical protein WEB13_07780 [Dehalococcoidia bacterium]
MDGDGVQRRLRAVAPPAAVFVVAFLVLALALAFHDRRVGDSFDLVRWERDTIAGKWLYAIGAPLRHDPTPDEAIARYFALGDRSSAEARRLEGAVEAAIAGRVDAVARAEGITGRLPLFGRLSVFPPVNLELAAPPEVLVVSPRAVVRRDETRLLRPGLAPSDAIALEARVERDPTLSALVVPSGGVATYPAVISNRASFRAALATAAHEWTHHYLAFYPLGRAYYRSHDAATINETVADIVGDELAALAVERFGDPTAAAGAPSPTASPPVVAAPGRDADQMLRELRIEVDALLAAGRVADAEARMEAARQELAAAGRPIRRINQAYFAWYGTYAARADAVDPLGPELRDLRARAGSLAAFLAAVRGTSTREGVGRALVPADPTPAR